jgi:hypothetical protein
LSLEHKQSVVSELASMLADLSKLKFEKIGCLQKEDGTIGPLLNCLPNGRHAVMGPFTSTLDYLVSFLSVESEQLSLVFLNVKKMLESYLSALENSPTVSPPFRIIHPDLDAQNVLLESSSVSINATDHRPTAPVTGIIDWDGAYTGPLYYFYEYPTFIQDTDSDKSAYAENEILRRHFARALGDSFKSSSPEQTDVIECMDKKFVLNGYRNQS